MSKASDYWYLHEMIFHSNFNTPRGKTHDASHFSHWELEQRRREWEGWESVDYSRNNQQWWVVLSLTLFLLFLFSFAKRKNFCLTWWIREEEKNRDLPLLLHIHLLSLTDYEIWNDFGRPVFRFWSSCFRVIESWKTVPFRFLFRKSILLSMFVSIWSCHVLWPLVLSGIFSRFWSFLDVKWSNSVSRSIQSFLLWVIFFSWLHHYSISFCQTFSAVLCQINQHSGGKFSTSLIFQVILT